MNPKENSKPWIKTITPALHPPSLNDNTADVDRLIRGLKSRLDTDRIVTDVRTVKRLSSDLRAHDFRVRAVLFESDGLWHVMQVLPVHPETDLYGLAVDLGTSTVVMRLVNLTRLEAEAETSFHNPQIRIGPDILTRIHFASQEGGLEKLQSLLLTRLNEEVTRLCEKGRVKAPDIVGFSVAGNTTMTHLFLGLNPYWLCREPYIPVINRPGMIRAGDLGLAVNPEAPVLVFPNVGSYFGGDLIAGILASEMIRNDEVSLLVDVGTNAEVVMGNRDWLMGCAGAAGPALEGGVARMGMMAGPGVIDQVKIDSKNLEFKVRTIDQKPPVGVCGSGLIDLVAQLFLAGMIDLRGKYVPEVCGERLVDKDGIKHLIAVPPGATATGRALTLSQPDIDALIRSKAAMFTILTTLARTVNVNLNEIDRFYVAGTFGAYIDPRSAVTLGMIPDLPLESFVSLGNTSLEGAAMALQSAKARDDIYHIRDRITYLELNVNQEFMNLFSAAKFIPHTDRSLFPSVPLPQG